jgi:hypothetical protein
VASARNDAAIAAFKKNSYKSIGAGNAHDKPTQLVATAINDPLFGRLAIAMSRVLQKPDTIAIAMP